MTDDKLLALAIDYDNAPQDVKDAVQAYYDSYLLNEKAKKQIELWTVEQRDSEKDLNKADRQLKRALRGWDVAGLEGLALEEA